MNKITQGSYWTVILEDYGHIGTEEVVVWNNYMKVPDDQLENILLGTFLNEFGSVLYKHFNYELSLVAQCGYRCFQVYSYFHNSKMFESNYTLSIPEQIQECINKYLPKIIRRNNDDNI